MMTPIPAVKPTMTGAGINLIIAPILLIPSANRMIPAIKVAICNPSMPYCAVMPDNTTMNAPVGPAICKRLPPKSETAKPAIMEV